MTYITPPPSAKSRGWRIQGVSRRYTSVPTLTSVDGGGRGGRGEIQGEQSELRSIQQRTCPDQYRRDLREMTVFGTSAELMTEMNPLLDPGVFRCQMPNEPVATRALAAVRMVDCPALVITPDVV